MVKKCSRSQLVAKINSLSSERMSLLAAGHENLTDVERRKERELQDHIDQLVELIVEMDNE